MPRRPRRQDVRDDDLHSGKIIVRLPKSLHAALEEEAWNEKTSMNALIVAKLAISLRDMLVAGRKAEA